MGYGMDEEDWGDIADDDMNNAEAEAMLKRYRQLPGSGPVRNCAACNSQFKVKHLRQRFCKGSCKDRFHNLTNPERRERAKQICRR